MPEGWIRADPTVPFDRATAGLSPRQAELIERLTRHLISTRPMRWTTLQRYAKRGLDRIDVERTVKALFDAGWVEHRMRRDSRGDPVPTQLRLLESAIDAASTLIGTPSPTQRQRMLRKITEGLLERQHAGGPPIPERVFVRQVFGQTKAVRLRDFRAELEAVLTVPLENLVRFHVDLVLTAGPVRYRFGEVQVDLRGSTPWAAITEPVAARLTDVDLGGADELICIENQTPFEAVLYEGLADRTIVMFTSGFLGTVQRDWIRKLIHAGVRRVRHWGDLDPWGLEIYRDLSNFVRQVDARVQVRPWRMEPEPLERPDTQKLTTEDWIALHRYLKRDGVPLRETAEAMKRLGRKLEQEALLENPV